MGFVLRFLVSLMLAVSSLASAMPETRQPVNGYLQHHLDDRLRQPEEFLRCSARLIHSSMSVNCSRLGYTVVPRNIARSVRIVDLSKNFLRRVDETDFRNYTRLEVLRLESNLLEAIEERSFENLKELQVLNLRNNRLSRLDSEHFAGLNSLTTLDLGRNTLRHLNSSVFLHMPYLKQLYLDGCSLDAFDVLVLSSLPYLESLDLAHNHLRTIAGAPPTHDLLPEGLKMLDISHNPWTCDCNLQWLARQLHDSEGAISWHFINAGPKCREPPLYAGINWKELHPSRFFCLPEIAGSELAEAPLTAPKYGNVTLRCHATGGPRPTVSWTFNGRNVSQAKQLSHRHVVSEQGYEERHGRHVVRSSLSVYGLNEAVAGKYTCSVENAAGLRELSYFVRLSGEDSAPAAKVISVVNAEVFLPNRTLYWVALGLVCLTGVVLFGLVAWCFVAVFRWKSRAAGKFGRGALSDSESVFFLNNSAAVRELRKSRLDQARLPKMTNI